MGTIKQIDIRNRAYYFYDDMINVKHFDVRLLRIHDCENIYSVNPFYLLINHAIGYIEENRVNKYLIFNSTEKNKELLKNDIWNGIRDKIKKISCVKCDYEKDYMKIKINSDDNLPLNKQLKFHNKTITIRSVSEEDGKFYPQVFLDDTLYELNV